MLCKKRHRTISYRRIPHASSFCKDIPSSSCEEFHPSSLSFLDFAGRQRDARIYDQSVYVNQIFVAHLHEDIEIRELSINPQTSILA